MRERERGGVRKKQRLVFEILFPLQNVFSMTVRKVSDY